ncbi:GreA/GreB family elongation factor [Patescibacteria group bacterium]
MSLIMAKKFMPPKPDPIKLTKEKLEQSKKDLESLSKERAEILIRLQAAREMGDLSENGAYTAAKSELRDTDRKIRHLERLLKWGVIVENKNTGTIDFDSKVVLNSGQKDIEYHLVSGFESDPLKGKLSVYSPIGKALVGKKAGEQITVNTPNGKTSYKIVSVK